MLNKLKNMVENSDSRLYVSVANDLIDSVSDSEELEGHIKNILQYGCISGCVSSQIYYTDTQKFFTDYNEEILELLDTYVKEYGNPHFEINSNNLSWFAYEETTRDIANDLEIMF